MTGFFAEAFGACAGVAAAMLVRNSAPRLVRFLRERPARLAAAQTQARYAKRAALATLSFETKEAS